MHAVSRISRQDCGGIPRFRRRPLGSGTQTSSCPRAEAIPGDPAVIDPQGFGMTRRCQNRHRRPVRGQLDQRVAPVKTCHPTRAADHRAAVPPRDGKARFRGKFTLQGEGNAPLSSGRSAARISSKTRSRRRKTKPMPSAHLTADSRASGNPGEACNAAGMPRCSCDQPIPRPAIPAESFRRIPLRGSRTCRTTNARAKNSPSSARRRSTTPN